MIPVSAAQLQIIEVELGTEEILIVVARCLTGVVHVGTRFRRICDIARPIDLTVIELRRYVQRTVETIDPPHTARVVLAGSGGESVRPGHLIQEPVQA